MTKPQTTDGEQLAEQLASLVDKVLVSSSSQKEHLKTRFAALIQQRDQQRLTKMKSKMVKHFTSWGGSQGNCIPEDVLDDFITATLAPDTTNGVEEKKS